MSRPAPRRPSRTTTPKPRKIAGRDVPPAEAPDAASEETLPGAPPPRRDVPAPAPPPRPPKPPSRPTAKASGDGDRGPSALRGEGATITLLALVAVCVVLLVLQGVWFVVHNQRNGTRAVDPTSSSSTDSGSDDPISVPSGRPVVLNEVAVQEGVDAAASAAQVMFARSWKTYDDGVDDAVKLMTDSFAKEYRATTDDVRDEFIKKKTQVEVRVVAQSVVRANDTSLEALIFLNQYVIRGTGKDAKTTYTPYRALLTMVHTDEGWLVDNLDTK